MRPSDELRADHDVVRATLDLLDQQLHLLLRSGASTSLLADSLATRLRLHTANEERLLANSALPASRRSADALEHLLGEHENQRIRLAILHELLTQPELPAGQQVAAQASDLIKNLREHMASEEALLFSVMDQEEGQRGQCPSAAVAEKAVEMLGFA